MIWDYLEKLNARGSVLGLQNIRRLLAGLGNPQETVPVIHVAGTNGKGSTIAFIESILREAGFRVGKYTSPTIVSYYERFQMDGSYIDEDEFARLLLQVKQEADLMEADEQLFPTAFEVETAIAFLYCQSADVMLLETGMGGRLDSTNVVSRPLVTVMASISMDHMQFLGNSLFEIATEKAGILRAGVPCVSNPANSRVESVLKKACSDLLAPYISVGEQEYCILDADIEYSRFSFNHDIYEIHLPGLFQVDNAVTAIMTVQQACSSFRKRLAKEGAVWQCRPEVEDALSAAEDIECIRRGLCKAKWPARLEHAACDPDFYLDGAHNEDACIRLRESVVHCFAGRPKILIAGVLKDKEYEKMMALLVPLATGVFTVTPDSKRALDGKILADVCQAYCGHVAYCDSLKEAVVQARGMCEDIMSGRKSCAQDECKPPVIIAFGSLSYLGELKKWID